MAEPACPSCGEAEELEGRPVGDDIAVTCGRCGAEWMRGEPRCKCCGRTGGTTMTQQMTRHPRGTLLAVVGARKVTLCGTCDAEVIAAALRRKQPVPEGYVSRFLFGEIIDRPTAAYPARSRPTPPRRSTSSSSSKPVAAPRPTGRAPAPTPTDPTLRQATVAFLNEAGDQVDSLTMVLLGTKLGASTRLSRLDTPDTTIQLSAWIQQTYRPEQRPAAVETLRRAFSYWRSQGWLSRDLAAGME